MKIRINILFILLVFFITGAKCQVEVKLKETNGIYTMPCKVNGLQLDFIFDTGASSVLISMAEASFMLKNGYLEREDITGIERFKIADGSIVEGVSINIRRLEIGNHVLNNVKASVSNSLEAPLLLGQSAIKKLGGYSFDYDRKVLIFNDTRSTNSSINSNKKNLLKVEVNE